MDYETILIVVIVALVVAGGMWFFLRRGRGRDTVEQVRSEKAVSERVLAKELADTTEKLADKVEQNMENYGNQLIETLKGELGLQNQKIYSSIEAGNERLIQIRLDFEEFKRKTRRDLELMQTMAWGADAKSIPPYMKGEEETQEHRDEPLRGAFRVQSEEEFDDQIRDNVKRQKEEKEDAKNGD